MALTRKHYIIAGALAVGVSAFAGAAYLQYKRMMNFVIKLRGVKFIKLATNVISFDLLINFTNQSKASIHIMEVLTKVYINDKFVVDIKNSKPFTIEGESTSPIAVNISINPGDIRKAIELNYLSILSAPENVNIRAEIKMKAKLMKLIPVNFPYTYKTTLKEIMAPKAVVSE